MTPLAALPCPPITADFTAKGAGSRLRIDLDALKAALAVLPAGAPVVVLIHGYRFRPGARTACPHRHILSLAPQSRDAKAISWPQNLGLNGSEGLAIALGWPAGGSLWRAHRMAARSGAALAAFAEVFAQLAPGRPLHVMAHSMGTRVALCALALAGPGRFGRMILLSGAETRALARRAMASPAGQSAEVINVTSRENDLFDAAFEWLVHFGRQGSIGQGLGQGADGAQSPSNWRDLWIDHPQTLRDLAASGFALTAPKGRISHWSAYLRPGVFPLYRALLQGRMALHDLPQAQPARRWSLLMARPGAPAMRTLPSPARLQAMP